MRINKKICYFLFLLILFFGFFSKTSFAGGTCTCGPFKIGDPDKKGCTNEGYLNNCTSGSKPKCNGGFNWSHMQVMCSENDISCTCEGGTPLTPEDEQKIFNEKLNLKRSAFIKDIKAEIDKFKQSGSQNPDAFNALITEKTEKFQGEVAAMESEYHQHVPENFWEDIAKEIADYISGTPPEGPEGPGGIGTTITGGGTNVFCAESGPNTENPKIDTALGCIPIRTGKFIEWLLPYVFGIAGGISFLLMVSSFISMTFSGGDPKKIQGAKETITSAIIGLLLSVFSLFILRLISVNILRIPGIN